MFGRIFGRGKDEPEAAVCAMCGRTLLAGEWTRKVTGPNGEERLVCSLCGPDLPLDDRDLDVRSEVVLAAAAEVPDSSTDGPDSHAAADSDTGLDAPVETGTANAPSAGAVVASEPDSAEPDGVVALERRLAQVERRFDQLSTDLAELRELVASIGVRAAEPSTQEEEAPIDSSEPGERTWGETPAEFAALLRSDTAPAEASGGESAAGASPEDGAADQTVAETPAEPALREEPAIGEAGAAAVEDEAEPAEQVAEQATSAEIELAQVSAPEETQLMPAVEVEELVEDASAAGGAASPDYVPQDEESPDEVTAQADAVVPESDEAESGAGSAEAEVAALALLQRGVDLFNVSRVPRRIAETNEQLGSPEVRAEPLEDDRVAITFMWSMGWYRFHVDTDSGDVDMADRGYEEIKGVLSNAGVRADGTVHLAPAQISPAAAQRAQQEDAAGAARSADRASAAPESASAAAQKPPEILSKSLLGQRSDDEPADWEKTRARDFDWER